MAEDDEPMTQEQAEAIALAYEEVQKEWAKLAKVVGVEWPNVGLGKVSGENK